MTACPCDQAHPRDRVDDHSTGTVTGGARRSVGREMLRRHAAGTHLRSAGT